MMITPIQSSSSWWSSSPVAPLVAVGLVSGRRDARAARVGLEEDAERQLGLHRPVAVGDLVQGHVRDAGDAIHLLELLEEHVEAVEVARQAHLDRLLAVVGRTLALERLDRLGL